MSNNRGATVAVMAAVFALLLFGQAASRGIEVPRTTALAAPTDPSTGATARTSVTDGGGQAAHGGSAPVISGNGQWQVLTSLDALQPDSPGARADQSNVFVRNLQTGHTTQLSLGTTGPGNGDLPEPPNQGSTRPDITDNGRYVSFITSASNIVTVTGANPLTLVVCDRDPDDDGTFDEPAPAGGLTNVCAAVYSSASTADDAIDTFDTPRLEGLGGRIVWTQQTLVTASPPVTGTHVWTAGLTGSDGALAPGPPLQVPMLLTTPAGCGTRPAGAEPVESEPVITDNGSEIIVAVTFPWSEQCSAIVGTGGYTQPGFERTTRYDVVPAGCGTGYLGDGVPLTGACTPGDGGAVHYVSTPAIDEYANSVLFRYHNGPSHLGFTAPRTAPAAGPHAALSATDDTDWMLLTRYEYPDYASQIVSRDNTGAVVDSTAGALSEDGRFLVFATAAPNTHDGADIGTGVNQQLVARDLQVDDARADAGQPRRPGALVTARDASLPTPPGCTPAAGQSCASLNATESDISMDDIGAHVSFRSSATDLVPGDTNNAGDAFVRTWQPTLSNGTTDVAPLQAGDSTIVSVPVRTDGFGPVVLGTTSLGGPDAADFRIEGTTCDGATVYVDDDCAVSVRVAPDTVGTETATVSVSSAQLGTVSEVRTLRVTVIATGPTSAPGDTSRVSLTNAGAQSALGGYGGRESMVSGNGRWDVFTSDSEMTGRPTFDPDPADDSPPVDRENVFVRDLADPQHTVQLSLHTDFATHPTRTATTASRPIAVAGHPTGVGANGASYRPSISSDGRFVSFYTNAKDIVAPRIVGAHDPGFVPDHTLVVCDRDPTGTKDSAGNPVLDRPRPGTQVPNYVCFPVESGTGGDDGPSADQEVTPRLAGNGSRITWTESVDFRSSRARFATLSLPGGALHAPSGFGYVPSTITNFEDPNTRGPGDTEQFDPAISENGTIVVYTSGPCSDCTEQSGAVIETNLTTGTSVRVDAAPGPSGFLGDDPDGGFDTSPAPAVSDDGNRVAFAFQADGEDFPLVYVATRAGGAFATVVSSRDNAGNRTAGDSPALSGDGRYLAFVSSRPNSHNGIDPPNGSCFVGDEDAGVNCQIVARDLEKDAAADPDDPWVPSEIVSSSITTTCATHLPPGRVCASTIEGQDPDESSSTDTGNPSIDATGSEIGFDSDANDIVTGDTNIELQSEGGPVPATDAFVHTWRPTLSTTGTFDFGTVDVGAHRDKSFTVTESGFGPISLGPTSVVGTNPGDYTVLSTTCTGRTLNDTQTCAIKVRFAPTLDGSRKATLQTVVGRNGYSRHNPQNTISYDPALIRGLTGVGHSRFGVASAATVNFGTRLPEAPGVTKKVSVTNTGAGPLKITGTAVVDPTAPDAHGDYAIDDSNCITVLAVGGTCTITVTFVGHAVGRRDAVLVVDDNTATGSTSVNLVAVVGRPAITASPGVSPVGRPVTVSGTGFAPNRSVDVGFGPAIEITAETDANGVFEVALMVLPNGPQGPRTIHAQSHGVSPSISAETPLLVVLGSLDNPGLVIRH